jgi:hypothetical protein
MQRPGVLDRQHLTQEVQRHVEDDSRIPVQQRHLPEFGNGSLVRSTSVESGARK